ncbi:MAG: DUF559 domain-containing protein [Solirubrobacterales bacterium]|nr:DUF559 domain-containing protein [Solirubrobacterales bacterium]
MARARTGTTSKVGHAGSRTDRAIAVVAALHHGVVTLDDLRKIGLSPRAVRHRCQNGRLHRLHQGVYCVGPPNRHGRWAAAVAACGQGAVLSHRAAAALWGLIPAAHGPVDVTAGGRTGRRRPGIAIHSGASLNAEDRTSVDGIPCTSIARTLIDFAAVESDRGVANVVERAEELRVFDLRAVDASVARLRPPAATGRLTRVLAGDRQETRVRSPAERVLLEAVLGSDLPRPRVNPWLPLPDGDGYRPDLLWPRERLVVEVDGRAHHARRAAFERDRRRDRRLARERYETVRFSAREVLDAPYRAVAEIRALLLARAG